MERKRCADFSWNKTCATTPFSSTGILFESLAAPQRWDWLTAFPSGAAAGCSDFLALFGGCAGRRGDVRKDCAGLLLATMAFT